MKDAISRFLLLFIVIHLLLPFTVRAGDDRTVDLTVMKNDSLINICKKYLQDEKRWPEIGRFNHLRNFDLIRTGQTLIIPVRLLKGVPVDGRVSFVKGDVRLRTSVESSWKAIQPDDPVPQGSSIRTGDASAVEIIFADGSTLYQRQNTTVGLASAERKGALHMLHRIYLSAGRVLMKVRSAAGQASRIEIHTPSAVAVARGTDFRVSLDSAETTISEVVHGLVDVEAGKTVVRLREGEGTRVGKGEVPQPPRKLLPAPPFLDTQPLYRTLPALIGYGKVEGAASYRFLLSTDKGGRDLIRETVVRAGESLVVTDLTDGTYYLLGCSIDNVGIEGVPSSPLTVTVRINPLPPCIREPAEGTRYKGKSATFQWLKVDDAACYQIQFARDREFGMQPEDPKDVKDLEVKRDFHDFGTYYFRVRSLDRDAYPGLWSDAVGFTLEPPPPSPPVEKPAVHRKELHIRWRDLGEKMTYHCQIARDAHFSTLILDENVKKPEITLPRPKSAGTYYVRTSSIDPNGYEGEFSPSQSFEVKRRWPLLGIVGLLGAALLVLL